MKLLKQFRALSKFELALWLLSVAVVSASFLLSPDKDYLSLCASVIGVTALIFVAKGYLLGQVLTIIFALFFILRRNDYLCFYDSAHGSNGFNTVV